MSCAAHRVLLCLCLAALIAGCTSKSGQGRFQQGRQALATGQYDEAVSLLEQHLNRNPDGRLASRATFLIAKAHLGRGDLAAAQKWFERVVDQFPDSEERHKSRYKLAEIALWKGDLAAAQAQFQVLADRPDGTLAPEAVAMSKFLNEVTLVREADR